MATRAQRKANRANAKRSTGPKTDAGKQTVRYNRTCHGLAGNQIVIDQESAEAYEALRKDLIQGYAPANSTELALVEEIAQNFWRIQRGRALEAETFNINSGGAAPVIAFGLGKDDFERLRRYMATIERSYYRILTHLLDVQKARRQWEREQPSSPAPSLAPEIHIIQSERLRAVEPLDRSQFFPAPEPVNPADFPPPEF